MKGRGKYLERWLRPLSLRTRLLGRKGEGEERKRMGKII